MIVSASYRTDIPAFYGEWFINRLHAGYCNVFNPYSRKPYAVDLRPEAVDGEAAARRLAGAIRIKTITYDEKPLASAAEFGELHAFLAAQFP